MADELEDSHFTRREWLQANAALGAAIFVPGCARLRLELRNQWRPQQ